VGNTEKTRNSDPGDHLMDDHLMDDHLMDDHLMDDHLMIDSWKVIWTETY